MLCPAACIDSSFYPSPLQGLGLQGLNFFCAFVMFPSGVGNDHWGPPSLLVDLVRRFHHQKCFIICWPICHHVDWSKKKMAHGCDADWHATGGSSACTTLCGPAETQPSMVSSKVAWCKMSSTCYEHLRRVSHLLI